MKWATAVVGLLLAIPSASGLFHLQTVTDDAAVCLDGSPYAFYVARSHARLIVVAHSMRTLDLVDRDAAPLTQDSLTAAAAVLVRCNTAHSGHYQQQQQSVAARPTDDSSGTA